MRNFIQWIRGKKEILNLDDCTAYEVEKSQSDSFYGGFKEYKPPIYEHESAVSTKINISDLISDHTIQR